MLKQFINILIICKKEELNNSTVANFESTTKNVATSKKNKHIINY